MATRIRVATFNCENLFSRFTFRKNANARLAKTGFTRNNTQFVAFSDEGKRITRKAVEETAADIICLQEVEDLFTLDKFNGQMPSAKRYAHRVVIDSHDPRFIDVAVLSRFPFHAIRTHRHETTTAGGSTFIFSRDCLEVDIDIRGKLLTLYVNHLKSMMGGRPETHARRLAQAKRVREIVNSREGGTDYRGNFIVLGDLNDYVDERGHSALTPLLNHHNLVNVLKRADKADRWTHFWAKKKEYRQLDYLLLGKKLDARAGEPIPGVLRKGLPKRATRFSGERFRDVGLDAPKASDHCPVFVDIPTAALK